MIQKCEGFRYPGVEATTYKDEPGTWMSVSRRLLAPASDTGFETRYFEVAPGGYTSLERHHHEHVVVVLRGEGIVRLGDEETNVAEGDVVHVSHGQPHQFRNGGATSFGILCIVDRDRDRPTLLHDDLTVRTSE